MADTAEQRRKKIIENAKKRGKGVQSDPTFPFELPSILSNGPLPQKGITKSQGPSFAATLPKRNNRTFTQKIGNRLFGKAAVAAAPAAPAPAAAPVNALTERFNKVKESIISTYEKTVVQKPKDKEFILELYENLKKTIVNINSIREELKVAKGVELEIKKRKLEREYNSLESNSLSLLSSIRNINTIIEASNSLQKPFLEKGNVIFTLRLPIYMQNINDLAKYINERIKEIGKNEKILSELSEKVKTLDLTDNSNEILKGMTEAFNLFGDNIPFIEKLQEIRKIRNKMYRMNSDLELAGLDYSYDKSINHDSTTIQEHKNKIIKVLKAKHNDNDIKLYLERRGQFDDAEEMNYVYDKIDNINTLKELLKITNYIRDYDFKIYGISINDDKGEAVYIGNDNHKKKINEAINDVVHRYFSISRIYEGNIALSLATKISNLRVKNITNKHYKEVIKSIIKENKRVSPYRLIQILLTIKEIKQESIRKDFIERIYDSIDQEEMDDINKRDMITKEIDTVEKALAFMKKYTLNNREKGEEDRYRASASVKLLDENNLWPRSADEAKAFIEKYKDIPTTDPKYFILEKAYTIVKEEFRSLSRNQQLNKINKRSKEKKEANKLQIQTIEELKYDPGSTNVKLPFGPFTAEDCIGDIKKPGLRQETLAESFNRTYVFLYYKMKNQEVPADVYKLTESQKNELRSVFTSYKDQFNAGGPQTNKIIKDIFHYDDPVQFQNDFTEFQNGGPSRILARKDDNGTQICAFACCTQVERVIGPIELTDEQLEYRDQLQKYQASSQEDRFHIYKPHSDILDHDINEAPYIIVENEYFPESTHGKYLIGSLSIKNIDKYTFIKDAVENNGIISISNDLKAAVEKVFGKVTPQFTFQADLKDKLDKARIGVEKALKKRNQTRKNLNAKISFVSKAARQKKFNNAEKELKFAKNLVDVYVRNSQEAEEFKKKVSLAPAPAAPAAPVVPAPAAPVPSAPVAPVPTANNLNIRNENGPEARMKKRIGTIRKKVKNLRGVVNALKRGGRRTRRHSRK